MLGGGDTTGSVLGSGGGGGAGGGGGDAAPGPSGAHDQGNSASDEGAVAAPSTMIGSTSTSNNNNSGEDEKGRVDESGGGFGGNRWPRQETLALLKIRSDMDVAFRDASVKGPLWEEVSRKLAELGYHRSAKKCKEKFENVYKYHKRTKEGRTGKPDGKTYRFFDQLEALENHPPTLSTAPPPKPQPHPTAASMPPLPASNPPLNVSHITVSSTTTLPGMPHNIVAPAVNLTIPSFPNNIPSANPTIQPLPQPSMASPTNPSQTNIPSSFHNVFPDPMSNSTSSSTSSDIELGGRQKRKRKWKDYFQRLMKEVIVRQEEMQKKFLEAIEKREHERMAREEAWRMQEMARINREREILAQERSMAAAKDAAVMAFLQKISEQQNPQPISQQPPAAPAPPPPPPPQPVPARASSATTPAPQPLATVAAASPPAQPMVILDASRTDNGGQSFLAASSSRWPKIEVQALIKLRTSLDAKYQESGPKGPLWEEISAAMRKLGYNRSAKRCKEKWENINKYFKKVKESNKKRPDDSKTCPYFHQLEALYREKNKTDVGSSNNQVKPENSVPLMVRPEQQWPPPPPHHSSSEPEQNPHDSAMEDMESDQHMDQNQDDDDRDGEGDDEEEDEGGGYEIVASKPVSMGTSE